jgi:AraC-like DNA-binding protein
MPSQGIDSEQLSAERHAVVQSGEFIPTATGDFLGEHPTIVRVKRYIEQHLGSTALSPVMICRNVGVSRSQLYRLFSGSDGVSRYIRTRRLLKARAVLLASAERVSNVAFAFGFSSHAHFSRVFKQTFGYAPGNVLVRAAPVMASQTESPSQR